MILLAMELSSRRGSVALWRDDVILGEASWQGEQARGEQVFLHIDTLLATAGIEIGQIDVFGVGRGPGGFSGIRMAVTAAQSFALPRQRKVLAVSSGGALAHAIRARHPSAPVAVVGDARRGTWWFGLFDAQGSQQGDWVALPPADVLARIPPDAVIASPDWDRLAAAVGADPRWIREAAFPSASAVAQLCGAFLARDTPGEPISPIYIHPAVD